MNQEEKNKLYFQETFEEVHAPEGLCRKVKNMTKTEAKKLGMSVVKKLAVAAAIAAVLFAGSNGVAYAMTGSTWLETVVVHFNINGVAFDKELTGELNEDGTVTYSGVVEGEDGTTAIFIDSDSECLEQEYYVGMDSTVEIDRQEVIEEDGRVYLADGDVKIDITDDIQDGQASGTYEKKGLTYSYEISGSTGCWEYSIYLQEETE